MKNLVKQKIISIDRKINPSDPENDFWSYFTFKAFLKFLSSTQSDSPSASAPPNTPMRGRQSSTPHADADPRSIHTPMSSAAVFPSTSVGFLHFLLFSHSTSPPRSRQDHGLSRSHPSTIEIALSRSSHMTHPRSISLFSIYLSLSLNF